MNRDFITLLANKLKTGNLRSIHLNALPGRYATRLDITSLDIVEPPTLFSTGNSTSQEFLFEHLLKKSNFQFQINLESVSLTTANESTLKSYGVLAKRLSSLQSENEDNYLEHGIQTFGLGFPVLVKRSKKDPSKVIKAPLLIWNLEIERSHNQRNQWIIKKTEDSPIYVNEVLISHLSSDESLKLKGIDERFLDDNVIDIEELTELLKTFLGQLDTDVDDVEVRLQKASDKDHIERITTHKPWIMWSGIFGLFRTQKQSIIRDTEQLLDEFDDFDFSNLKIERFLKTANACISVDPSQQAILKTLEANEFKVIQGPPGTGKSQSLTAIISNVLENEGKVLVVCEKRTALEVIYRNLELAGMQNLIAFVEDVNRDRKKIIDTVRQVTEAVKWVYTGFNEGEYDQQLKTLDIMRDEFDARDSNLNGLVFQGTRFKNLIGTFLRLKRRTENNLFSDLAFKLTEEEFFEVDTALRDSADLYSVIEENSLVFDVICCDLFKNPLSASLEKDIFQKLEAEREFLDAVDVSKILIRSDQLETETKIREIIEEFDFQIFQSTLQHVNESEQYWNELIEEFLRVEDFISLNSILVDEQLKHEIYSIKSLSTDIERLKKYFSSVKDNLEKIEQAFLGIPASNRQQPVLTYHWSTKLLGILGGKYKTISTFWRVLDESSRLISSLSDEKLLGSKQNIAKFLDEKTAVGINAARACQTIQKCIENRTSFRDYYQWRRHKESLSKLPKMCISILASSTIIEKSWAEAFQFGYFSELLEKYENLHQFFNENDSKLNRISELEKAVQESQKHKVLKIWDSKQFEAINAYNRRGNIKWLFNYRKNSQYNRKNSLRSIVHQEFELFTQLFPVMLVTPTVASSLLPLKQGLFDIVLFDEASQLRLEDTYPSIVRGKLKVISGDKHQMPPSSFFANDISLDVSEQSDDEESEQLKTEFERTNPLFLAESESLLDFGNNLNPNILNTSFLDFHYRSKHPSLIGFSNAAFYGSRLIPLPEKETYSPIQLIQVDGLYETTQTNPSEAEAILIYLRDRFPVNGDGTYPSLGIATFNIQQRNLIKERIYDYSYKDEKFRKKLELIGAKEEFFVKNLENVQGDERDIIIISTTFGPNQDGKFRQSFGPLNTAKGHRLLNVIVTRGKDRVIVFTSIPKNVYASGYQDAIPTQGNKGKAMLYAYLDYCGSVSEANEDKRQDIVNLLADNCEEKNPLRNSYLIESPFEQEVYDYLRDYISIDRIVPQFKLGGFRVDFMITDEHSKPKIAIECDGAQFHSGIQAYAYDLHRQKILEGQGLKVFRIWSKTWFPNPDREVLKIVNFIQQFEPSAIKSKSSVAV